MLVTLVSHLKISIDCMLFLTLNKKVMLARKIACFIELISV